MSHPQRPHSRSQARRHFIGLVAATGARLAAATAVGLITLSSAKANNGRGWGVGGTPPGGGKGHGPKCFLKGTLISMVRGEVPVERLQIGDLVETFSGAFMPIKWIGRQTFKKCGPTWHKGVAPVRIGRFAFDEKSPRRDLFLSPTHGILIDGVFVKARDLVNGTSITRVSLSPGAEILEYFHILLDTHEAIFAEAVPVASFRLHRRNHECFDNFIELEQLTGGAFDIRMRPYASEITGKEHFKALLVAGFSPFGRVHDPLGLAYERIAQRGLELEASR